MNESKNILLQDAAKPTTELEFPSVTICSPGLNMEAVKEAILEDFNNWRRGKPTTESSIREQLDEFMMEKYAMSVGENDILATIQAMNSPQSTDDDNQGSDSVAVVNNLVACQKNQSRQSGRSKRSSEGKYQIQFLTFQELSSGCVRKEAVRMYGTSAGNKMVVSQQACAQYADQESALFWTYARAAGQCYLLNDNSDERVEDGWVSGNKDCGLMTEEEWTSIMVQDCSTEKDVSTAGRHWFYDKIVVNQQACAELAIQKGAIFWTYKTNDGHCYLKKNFEEKISSAEHRGKISGTRECGLKSQEEWTKMMASDCWMENNADSDGTDIFHEAVVSKQACAELSVAKKGLYWVYFTTKHSTCWVKKELSTKKTTINKDRVMGNMECGLMSQQNWTALMSSECKIEYNVSNECQNCHVFDQTVQSQGACAQLSLTSEEGRFWNYVETTGQCFVMKTNITAVKSSGWVFGNRECALITTTTTTSTTSTTSTTTKTTSATSTSTTSTSSSTTTTTSTTTTFAATTTTSAPATTITTRAPTSATMSSTSATTSANVDNGRHHGDLSKKEKVEVEDYLTMSSRDCVTTTKDETVPSKNEKLPAIDVFLNPSRAEELEEMLNWAKGRQPTHTEVSRTDEIGSFC